MAKENSYYSLLVFFSLVSFGFFGSLSHVFNLALIVLLLVNKISSRKYLEFSFRPLLLFVMIAGCFFLFLVSSAFQSNSPSMITSVKSISTMYPIPLIGLLILLKERAYFNLSSRKVSLFSQISILFSLFVYLILSNFFGPESEFYKFHSGRLTLFSGNPIPFSFAMLGVSIFCICDWKNANAKGKIIGLICFLIGSYFSTFMSGTRSAMVSIIAISPILIFYLFKKLWHAMVCLLVSAVILLILIYIHKTNITEIDYFTYIERGFETLFLNADSEVSVSARLDMWSASLKAFAQAPLFGYNVTERFMAIKPYLKDSRAMFTHPHNDIFASMISVGFFGGIAAFLTLISGFLASILSPNYSLEKICFGLMIAFSAIITANLSTVFFNDISAAWLAFSAYLIWAINFKESKGILEK